MSTSFPLLHSDPEVIIASQPEQEHVLLAVFFTVY